MSNEPVLGLFYVTLRGGFSALAPAPDKEMAKRWARNRCAAQVVSARPATVSDIRHTRTLGGFVPPAFHWIR